MEREEASLVVVCCDLGFVKFDVDVTLLFSLEVAGVGDWERHGFGLCGMYVLA